MLNLDPLIWSLAAALGIGLLIGTERERRKGTGPRRSAAGLRTFTLASLTRLLARGDRRSGSHLGNRTRFNDLARRTCSDPAWACCGHRGRRCDPAQRANG